MKVPNTTRAALERTAPAPPGHALNPGEVASPHSTVVAGQGARGTVLAAALDTASKGFYVFPVKGKEPLVKWREESTRDPERIKQWPPCDGYGVDCGKSGLAVIDLDPVDGEVAEFPVPLHGVRVTTPRGGKHIYTRNDGPEVRNSAGRVAVGVDVRATGGFVVGPGSAGYSGALPRVEDLPPLPQDVRALLVQERPQDGPGEWRPRQSLAELLASPPAEGGRNDWLTKVAGHHARTLADYGTFWEYVRLANEALPQPLDLDEVAKVAASVWNRESAQVAERREVFRAFDVAGWLAVDHPAPKRLGRGGVLYEGALHTLVGEPESGKSVLAYQWMVDVMAQGGRAVLLDEEAGPYDALGKLTALGLTKTQAERLTYLEPEGRDLVSLAAEFHEVVGHDCRILVVDSMAAALQNSGKDENSNQDVTEFVNRVLLPLTKKRGVAVVIVDHKTKNTNGERYARGASAKLGIVDMSVEVEPVTPFSREKDGLLKLTCHKDRLGFTGRGHTWQATVGTLNGLKVEIGPWGEAGARAQMGRLTEEDRKKDDAAMAAIAQVVERQPGVSRNQVCKAVTGRKERVLGLITLMADEGALVVTDEGVFPPCETD